MLVWMRLVHGLIAGKFCGLRKLPGVSICLAPADFAQRSCLAGMRS